MVLEFFQRLAEWLDVPLRDRGKESEQDEAGAKRKVQAEIGAIAFEAKARLIAGRPLGSEVRLQGFLSAKSKRSKKLILHVTDVQFVEGA